jgi:hypothetical protein
MSWIGTGDGAQPVDHGFEDCLRAGVAAQQVQSILPIRIAQHPHVRSGMLLEPVRCRQDKGADRRAHDIFSRKPEPGMTAHAQADNAAGMPLDRYC